VEDRRCKLGLAGRLQLVRLIESGSSLRSAAAQSAVSPATAHRWWHRWQAASSAERVSLACLATRSSRPHSCPWALGAEVERRVLDARERTNYGPARLAGLVGLCRGTIWKVLRRHDMSRRRRSRPRQSFRRFEWAQPGALLHIDAKTFAKFDAPGHWATGDRTGHRSRGAGELVVISVVDDHSRLAYSELHATENAIACSQTLRRAAAWMREQGAGPPEAVMSDNAKAFTSRAFRALLDELGARHILTPPYTPRWNGKLERFNQTLDTEWAHARVWPNSQTRDRALASFLRYYNRRRPHTSLGDRPPITRVQHL